MTTKTGVLVGALCCVSLIGAPTIDAQGGRPVPKVDLAKAKGVLAQHGGAIVTRGVKEPVEILRDPWGVPHIYAQNTADLFFAQGFVVAQDRLWQLELWRRNGEGRLAEVLGSAYVDRDRFARLVAFRGDWDAEFRKYHPEGATIFAAFARGVNQAIQKAIEENKVPVEFDLAGFRPQPVWTAKTVLTRMPAWTLSGNARSEVTRAQHINGLGLAKVEELQPTNPRTKLTIPPGLDLAGIDAAVLDITRGANDIRADLRPDLGSNNWVIDGTKSATGMPLLANDPHREIANPALRYLVHLVAPEWNVLGATEPGLPGVSIGHNERIAWAFTILGMDQQDLYVEETHPQDPTRYLYKGEWLDMEVEKQLIYVQGRPAPVEVEARFTRHGPVLREDRERHRAYALRWVGAEPGGAGYLGSLQVLQARDWQGFKDGVAKSWYIPSHSLLYADVEGNIGYLAAGLAPVRTGFDGLLPVPGKDGRYEWQGFLPYDRLPGGLNPRQHFYNSSNNDVVPKLFPKYDVPLGYEYAAPYRYERVAEALSVTRPLTMADMQRLQHDTQSLPAAALVPLLRNAKPVRADVREAVRRLLAWDQRVDADSSAAAIYEFWYLKLAPRVYAPRLPEAVRNSYRTFDVSRVIEWLRAPDAVYRRPGVSARAWRDAVLIEALEAAVDDLTARLGGDMSRWAWGDLHRTEFVHQLAGFDAGGALFGIDPVRRGGDGFTVMNTSNPSDGSQRQLSGASYMFVMDVKNWDESRGLSAPGNSGQPASPHYKDLVGPWSRGEYFPLLYTREAVEKAAISRLVLQPLRESTAAAGGEAPFELVQPELFSEGGAQPNAWADFDNDGDLDLFVGFRRGQLNRLYRNDSGRFTDVAAAVGLADDHGTRSAAWGDFDADGHLDLYVGFARGSGVPNRLYRNEGDGKRFTDVGRRAGVDLAGESRQLSWVDFDNDADVDLFVAFRDRPNALLRNDGGRFTNVAGSMGVDDARKTVGAVWFDMDEDGDLDLFVTNQDGDTNGFYRNDGARFVDVAPALGMDGAGRPPVYGGVGAAVGDFDNDGRLDLYLANYGPNALYRNEGGGRFRDVAAAMAVAGDYHAVTPNWGDFDNDGRLDLYVTAALANVTNFRDFLYRNDGHGFTDATPARVLTHDATQGMLWADFDRDGDLDVAVANNEFGGGHYLLRNQLPADAARRSMHVLVLGPSGRYTMAGAEVRVFAAGTRQLVATRLVETGSGYCSQSVVPVHVGLGSAHTVDVEVTSLTSRGRVVTRVAGVSAVQLGGRPLIMKIDARAGSDPRH